MSSFFLGFCSGIGAIVAASFGLGLVMLLRARDGEDEDGLSMRMRPHRLLTFGLPTRVTRRHRLAAASDPAR